MKSGKQGNKETGGKGTEHRLASLAGKTILVPEVERMEREGEMTGISVGGSGNFEVSDCVFRAPMFGPLSSVSSSLFYSVHLVLTLKGKSLRIVQGMVQYESNHTTCVTLDRLRNRQQGKRGVQR